MALLNKQGYGQLEPNFLVAQRTGEVYAQLPFIFTGVTINSNLVNAIEQGMFLKYDYVNQKVSMPPAGGDKLTFLTMNEIRLFGPFLTNKDFALFPSPTDATASYVSTGIIPGLGQSANQILSTSGNLIININSSPTGFTSGSYFTATVTFNDGSGVSTYLFTGTGTTIGAFVTTSQINGQALISGTQVIATQFTTTSGQFPIVVNKSISGVTFSGLNGATTSLITGSAYLNTAIAAAANYTSANVGNAYGQQVVYPRLYKPTIGDIITTNLVADTGGSQFTTGVGVDIGTFPVGTTLAPNAFGVLQITTGSSSTALYYRVVSNTTTPDLQSAVKLQCIQTP